jgi:hypothetical protein
VLSSTQAQALLSWIQQAKQNQPSSPPGGPTTSNCPDPSNFSLAVFQAEIQPILFGLIDLNDPTNPRVTTGCARATCHGADRTGGALVIKTTNAALDNLKSFACFVNLNNPSLSDVLLCPTNETGCRHYPHPGAQIFAGAQDLNYERILSYLYASKTAQTPLDFAYFARQVNPIFDDPNSVQGGVSNRTCTTCHGVAVAGEPAPNGSNFPMLANARSKEELAFNFSSAANFINFITPQASSLLLYPTDEVADPANPFSTGLHHPGGLDFATTSSEAQAIAAWAHGLRPDGNGFQPNWLVAGDYIASTVADQTPIDERNVAPAIFDPAGSTQFNDGLWDGLFSANTTVDLNAVFPRPSTSGRIAYAVAYVLNTGSTDVSAVVNITTVNAVELFINGTPTVQADSAASGISGLATFSAYGVGKGMTRVMLKLFQHATDPTFSFTVQFADQFGNPLTGTNSDLLIKLGSEGGI